MEKQFGTDKAIEYCDFLSNFFDQVADQSIINGQAPLSFGGSEIFYDIAFFDQASLILKKQKQ